MLFGSKNNKRIKAGTPRVSKDNWTAKLPSCVVKSQTHKNRGVIFFGLVIAATAGSSRFLYTVKGLMFVRGRVGWGEVGHSPQEIF